MMSASLSRRAFLRGQTISPLRPPWAIRNFIDQCSRCGCCLRACPAHILYRGTFNFPFVNFQQGACSFCGECARVCPDGALVLHDNAPWSYKVSINQQCLALRGVECRSCAEFCDSRAIVFRLRKGGVAQPQLQLENCNGCGACYAPCPVKAIEIKESSV